MLSTAGLVASLHGQTMMGMRWASRTKFIYCFWGMEPPPKAGAASMRIGRRLEGSSEVEFMGLILFEFGVAMTCP